MEFGGRTIITTQVAFDIVVFLFLLFIYFITKNGLQVRISN